MSLDHYISQVHLKNWYSPTLKSLMYATRKTDLQSFTTNAKSVCRIEDGSSNSFLKEERAVEGFLKIIEPKYNKSKKKILENKIDHECIYTIAGFISYILTCSPASMRINASPIKDIVKETTFAMDSVGEFSEPIAALGGLSITELIDTGKVDIKINEKYPQAIGIKNIISQIKMFGNFIWEILINTTTYSPFFTSDFPVAIEKTRNPVIANRIFPLSPYLAIRIKPTRDVSKENASFSFPKFKYIVRKINKKEVAAINKLIVQCAEDTIFYCEKYDWIEEFIKRNANFHIKPETKIFPSDEGNLIWATQKIAPKP